MSDDPSCPACPFGKGDEVDYDLGGNSIYKCDTCQEVWTAAPGGPIRHQS